MDEYKHEDIKAVKQIFSKTDFKVIDANYIENNKKILIKMLDKNGNVRMMWFAIDTGMGNYSAVSGIYAKR